MTTVLHKNLTGADAVHPAAFVQASDPGTVGANLFWIDTSTNPPTLKVRNATNTAWTTFATGATGATGPAGANGATGSQGPPGTNIVSGAAPYICIQDQKAQNTAGGTFTSAAWQTRTLNTVVANDQALAVLASNQITLPAGSWRTAIRCPAVATNWHQSRLQNITAAATVLTGSNSYANSGATYAQVDSWILGRFALLSPSVVAVQHQANTTRATDGFGIASNFGTEVYTVAEFWLEGPPPPFFGTTQLTENPGLDLLAARQRVSRAIDSSDQGAFISTNGPF